MKLKKTDIFKKRNPALIVYSASSAILLFAAIYFAIDFLSRNKLALVTDSREAFLFIAALGCATSLLGLRTAQKMFGWISLGSLLNMILGASVLYGFFLVLTYRPVPGLPTYRAAIIALTGLIIFEEIITAIHVMLFFTAKDAADSKESAGLL